MIVLIPAFHPDSRLLDLVRDVHGTFAAAGDRVRVLVVDDGSGPDHTTLFTAVEAAGAEVLTHPTNQGKGAALRTGVAHVLATCPGEGVVCADADGQHTAADILRVAQALDGVEQPDMVLGVRRFTGAVPLRSRVGNRATSMLLSLCTRLDLEDTQTGLRAYPPRTLPWLLQVGGSRYEYELMLLVRAAREHLVVGQVPIETVYLDENASSHFRPVRDSARVYAPFLRYVTSGALCFAIDLAILSVAAGATGSLLLGVVLARLVSGTANFTINRMWVFGADVSARRREGLRRDAGRYAMLAGALAVLNYLLLSVFVAAGVSLLAAKCVTEGLLSVIGFVSQRVAVFARTRAPHAHTTDPAPGTPAPATIHAPQGHGLRR